MAARWLWQILFYDIIDVNESGGVVRGQSCAENDHDQGQKVFHTTTGTTIFLLHQSKALDEAFQNGNGILVEAVVEAWGQF